MRVLVIGGSDRAGAYTVRKLARANHEVVDVDTVRPPTDLPGHFIHLDLTNAVEVYDAFLRIKPAVGTRQPVVEVGRASHHITDETHTRVFILWTMTAMRRTHRVSAACGLD
jgi:nucleoside-diphosphate-sugar epimerase